MADIHDILRLADHALAQDLPDRRRPGRAEVATELVPLLREAPDLSLEREDSAPIRGIAISVLLSAPFYAALYVLVRWMFS